MAESDQELFEKHLAGTTDSPMGLEIVKAEGLYLFDNQGKRYQDMIAGLAVANVGHRHPKVLAAIQAQADRFLHVMVYGEYIQAPQTRFAKALSDKLPNPLDTIYFVNSGTEANEAALKLAKRYTGRTQLIAFNASYHGNTHGSLSVSGNEQKKFAFRPLLPEVHFIDFNHTEQLDQITTDTAAVIIEPIQGDAGIRIPSKAYMQALTKRCKAVGALLIVDEIQTGFGRTGKWFGFEHFNIVPDIVTMGKGIGGGMAMGAFAAAKSVMDTLKSKPMLGHITTFGGHPLCCAAGLASLQVLEEESLIEQVEAKGKRITEHLSNHPAVKEIRQIGLFMAIEMDSFDTVYKVVNQCLEHGVIGFWFLSCKNSFRLAPPLTITNDQIDEACALILQSIDEVHA